MLTLDLNDEGLTFVAARRQPVLQHLIFNLRDFLANC
jgi:hypothetical protein